VAPAQLATRLDELVEGVAPARVAAPSREGWPVPSDELVWASAPPRMAARPRAWRVEPPDEKA
jgi:hypothetical protein